LFQLQLAKAVQAFIPHSLLTRWRLHRGEIKVDHSYVNSLTNSVNDAAIVRVAGYLAHELGIRVIAEGVENDKTLEMLKDMDCDEVQGMIIAPPMPAEEFESWLLNSGQSIQNFKSGKLAN